MQIRFWVEGCPKGQPRLRPRRIPGGRLGVYMPATAKEWRMAVAECAEPHRPARPIDGAVAVDIYWFLSRPGRLSRKKDPEGPVPHTAKPDRDNLDKSTLDALQAAGWFSDDSRVCAGHIVKCYAPKGRGPGAVIVIREAGVDIEAATKALEALAE